MEVVVILGFLPPYQYNEGQCEAKTAAMIVFFIICPNYLSSKSKKLRKIVF